MKKIAHHVKYHAGMVHAFAKQHITGISIAAFLAIVGFSACVAIDQSMAASMGKQTDEVLLSGAGNPIGGIKAMPSQQITKRGDKSETWTQLPLPGGELNQITGSDTTGSQTGGPKLPVPPRLGGNKKGDILEQIGSNIKDDRLSLEEDIKPTKPTKTDSTKSDQTPIKLSPLPTTTSTTTSTSTTSTTTTSTFSESSADFSLNYDKNIIAAISTAILKDMDKLTTKLKVNTSNVDSFQAGVILATKLKPALKKDFELWANIVSALPAPTNSDLKGVIKLDSFSLKNIAATIVQDMETVSKRVRKVSSTSTNKNTGIGSIKFSFYTDMMAWIQFKEQYASSK